MTPKEIREVERNIRYVQQTITNQVNNLKEDLDARPDSPDRLSKWASVISRQAAELVQYAAWIDGLRQAQFVLEALEAEKEEA